MELSNALNEIESYDVRYLPVLRAYLEKLDIPGIIDRCLDCKMHFNPGRVVMGLILDVLTGRTPLFRIKDFFEHQDIKLVIGKNLPLHAFGDHNIGRVLERLFEYGTMKIFTEISIQAAKIFHLDMSFVHEDTTSVSVWGEYTHSDTSRGVTINHGHSKDHRPDLKQFIFSLLCVEKSIPIFGKIENGNESDKTINRNILSHIAEYMSKHGVGKNGFIYVADSALVTNGNLKILGALNEEENVAFISRLPENYKECSRVIEEAIHSDAWTFIGRLSTERSRQNRPTALYRGCDLKVTLDGKLYRAVVIHSDFMDKRKKKRIDRELKRDKSELEKMCKEVGKIEFECEQNAQSFIRTQTEGKYHILQWTVEKKEILKRGRPKKDKKEINRIYYRLKGSVIPNDKLIEGLREKSGCFILLTNIGQEKRTPKEILQIYKEQYGVEQNFGFLKDPLIVNDLFLKKPERIEALGLILLLALLVWRLIERDIRQFINHKDITITGWEGKQTKNPTTFMMTTKFCSVHVLKLGNKRWLSRKLTPVQKEYLGVMGLDEEIFIKTA